MESDAHHTLVLGPGDHVEARNTVYMCNHYSELIVIVATLFIVAIYSSWFLLIGRGVTAFCTDCW